MELDLFGNPIDQTPIPLPRKEVEPEPVKQPPPIDVSNIPEFSFTFKKIHSIVKEPIPGGVRTTIWNE